MDSGVDPRRRAAESNRGGTREVRRGEDSGVDPRRGEDGGVELAAALRRNRERIVGAWKREKGSCDLRRESTRRISIGSRGNPRLAVRSRGQRRRLPGRGGGGSVGGRRRREGGGGGRGRPEGPSSVMMLINP